MREFIKRACVALRGDEIHILATLAAGEGNFLSPELLVSALRTHVGILSGDPMQESYRIVRRRVLLADGVTEFE